MILEQTSALLFYEASGGQPPASLDELVIEPDYSARYMAANPWPMQPPFDQLGFYQHTLERGTWERLLGELRQGLAERPASTHSFDSGSEYIEVRDAAALYSAEWAPARVPEALRPAVASLRSLISEVRQKPLAIVHVRSEQSSIQRIDHLALQFYNLGSQTFTFFDFEQADASVQSQIRFRLRKNSVQHAQISPLELYGLEPQMIANPKEWQPDPGGQVQLEPGGVLALEIPLSKALDRNTIIDILVRICFPRTTIRGEQTVEEGWLLLNSVTVSDTTQHQAGTTNA